MEHPHAKLLKRFIKETGLEVQRFMPFEKVWGMTQWKAVVGDIEGQFMFRLKPTNPKKPKLQQDFEDWYGVEYSDYALRSWDGDHYQNLDTELAWQSWQKSAALYAA